MSDAGRIFQLVGTFLPVYGIVLTAAAAFFLRKGRRLAALVVMPLIFLFLCYLFGEHIAYDGNMLYVLLALIYFAALCIYYPVLFIVVTVSCIRKSKTSAQQKGPLNG